MKLVRPGRLALALLATFSAFRAEAETVRAFAGQTVTLAADASGTRPFHFQWKRGEDELAGETFPLLQLPNVTAVDGGRYAVAIFNSGGSTEAGPIDLEVLAASEAPVVTIDGLMRQVTAGETLVLSAAITGGAPETLQWYRDDKPLPGQNGAALILPSVSAGDAGFYHLRASRLGGTVRSPLVAVSLRHDEARLSNLSVRAPLQRDADPLVLGLVVDGAVAAPFLLRAVGPTLEAFGVDGACDDPLFRVRSGETVVAGNDDWGLGLHATTLPELFQASGAFPFASVHSLDAAQIVPIQGTRTIEVRPSTWGLSGIGLFEAYDTLRSKGSEMINISALGQCGRGAEALVLGFAVQGTGKRTFLLRGVGPGLKRFGVASAVDNPVVKLHRLANGAAQLMAENDDWSGTALETAFGKAGAFGLQAKSKDAALVVELGEGAYTLTVTGDATPGRVLAEAYVLR